nr:cytochrome c [Azospirillum soli]
MVAGPKPGADPADAAQVAQGQAVYAEHCASCHGARLEGQPEWQSRKPDGRLPAPPHDASGHTWHHPDEDLFKITKQGVTAFAPPGYASDMPAFGGVLSDADIWAVLAYIKSTWPEDTRRRHAAMSERARK